MTKLQKKVLVFILKKNESKNACTLTDIRNKFHLDDEFMHHKRHTLFDTSFLSVCRSNAKPGCEPTQDTNFWITDITYVEELIAAPHVFWRNSVLAPILVSLATNLLIVGIQLLLQWL